MTLLDHLPMLAIVLPLAAGALTLVVDEARQGLKAGIAIATALALVVVGVGLVNLAATSPVTVYRVGDWAAPYGIVLVVDRVSAVLVLLAAVLGISSLVFALARWQRAGPRFHALVLFLLGHYLAGTPAPLYFAFPAEEIQSRAEASTPYTFQEKVDRWEDLGEIADSGGLHKVRVSFSELR